MSFTYQSTGAPGGRLPHSASHEAPGREASRALTSAVWFSGVSGSPGSMKRVVLPSGWVIERLVRARRPTGTMRLGTPRLRSASASGSLVSTGTIARVGWPAACTAALTLTPLPEASR